MVLLGVDIVGNLKGWHGLVGTIEKYLDSGSTSWELVNGGVSINDVHTENIFGASNLVTANS